MTMTIIPRMTQDADIRTGRNFTGADIAKYLVVKAVAATAPDSIALTAADTDPAIGVTLEIIKDQQRGDILVGGGRSEGIASGAITAGLRVAPDANGKIKQAAAGDRMIGTAVDAAAADGDIIMVDWDILGSAVSA